MGSDFLFPRLLEEERLSFPAEFSSSLLIVSVNYLMDGNPSISNPARSTHDPNKHVWNADLRLKQIWIVTQLDIYGLTHPHKPQKF